MKIAFLDDHPQLAEALAEVILQTFTDAEVECFSRWAELEPVLVSRQFDVLFLDMRLEDCLGAELIPSILESSPGTRVVVLSAFSQRDLLLKCLNLGIAGYISKTSPTEKIVEAIQMVLEGGTFFDENLRLGTDPASTPDSRTP